MFIDSMDYFLWCHIFFLVQDTKCFLLSEYLQRIRNQSLESYNSSSFASYVDEYTSTDLDNDYTGNTKRNERAIFNYSDLDEYSIWRSTSTSKMYARDLKGSWQTYSKWLYRNQTTKHKEHQNKQQTTSNDMFSSKANDPFNVREVAIHRRGNTVTDYVTILNIKIRKETEYTKSLDPTRTISTTGLRQLPTLSDLYKDINDSEEFQKSIQKISEELDKSNNESLSIPSLPILTTTPTWQPNVVSSLTTSRPFIVKTYKPATLPTEASSDEDITTSQPFIVKTYKPAILPTEASSDEDTTTSQPLSTKLHQPTLTVASSVEDITTSKSLSTKPHKPPLTVAKSVEDITTSKSLSTKSHAPPPTIASSVEDITTLKSLSTKPHAPPPAVVSSVEDITTSESLTTKPHEPPPTVAESAEDITTSESINIKPHEPPSTVASSVEHKTTSETISTKPSSVVDSTVGVISATSLSTITSVKSVINTPPQIMPEPNSVEDTTTPTAAISINPNFWNDITTTAIVTNSVEDTTTLTDDISEDTFSVDSLTTTAIVTNSVEDTTTLTDDISKDTFSADSLTTTAIVTNSVEDTTTLTDDISKDTFSVDSLTTTSSLNGTTTVENTTSSHSTVPFETTKSNEDLFMARILLGTLLAILFAVLLLVICCCLFWYFFVNRTTDEWHTIGHLEELFFYPVKSCGALELYEAQCSCLGLATCWCKDRYLMIIDNNCQCMSAERCPGLATIKPELKRCVLTLCQKKVKPLKLNLAEISKIRDPVTTAFCCDLEIPVVDCGSESRQWITRLLGGANQYTIVYCCTALDGNQGDYLSMFRDGAPYHLINQSTVDILNAMLPEEYRVTARNFRPNFVIKGATPFDEYNWSLIKIGASIFEVLKPCVRCVVTTIDPETGKMNYENEPLKTMKRCARFCDVSGAPCMGLLLSLRSDPRISRVVRCDCVSVTYSDCGLPQIRSCAALSRFKGADQCCRNEKRPNSYCSSKSSGQNSSDMCNPQSPVKCPVKKVKCR